MSAASSMDRLRNSIANHWSDCESVAGNGTVEGLTILWEAADRICGKRLKCCTGTYRALHPLRQDGNPEVVVIGTKIFGLPPPPWSFKATIPSPT
jgi:hypothetical protein